MSITDLAVAAHLSEGNVRRRRKQGETDEHIIRWGVDGYKRELVIMARYRPKLIWAAAEYLINVGQTAEEFLAMYPTPEDAVVGMMGHDPLDG